jgi:Na+/proline symporter
MGMPRRVTVTGMHGVDAIVVVTVVRGKVWMSISPPFTWEAIMTSGKVDEVIHALKLARDEATKTAAANNRNTSLTGNTVRAITKTANPET